MVYCLCLESGAVHVLSSCLEPGYLLYSYVHSMGFKPGSLNGLCLCLEPAILMVYACGLQHVHRPFLCSCQNLTLYTCVILVYRT